MQAESLFISFGFYRKYFSFKQLQPTNLIVASGQCQNCENNGNVELLLETV